MSLKKKKGRKKKNHKVGSCLENVAPSLSVELDPSSHLAVGARSRNTSSKCRRMQQRNTARNIQTNKKHLTSGHLYSLVHYWSQWYLSRTFTFYQSWRTYILSDKGKRKTNGHGTLAHVLHPSLSGPAGPQSHQTQGPLLGDTDCITTYTKLFQTVLDQIAAWCLQHQTQRMK